MTPPDDDLELIGRLRELIERCEWEGRNRGLPPFDYQTWYVELGRGLTEAADRLAALRAERDEARRIDLNANRFYRLMSGLDEDDHDKRAEHLMQQHIDGLSVGPNNRTSVKAAIAEHFAAVAEAAEGRERKLRVSIERMRQAALQADWDEFNAAIADAALSEPPR